MKSALLHKDTLVLRREFLLKALLIAVIALVLVSLLTGLQRERVFVNERAEAQRIDKEVWMGQGARNPHAAAHFSRYAFRPASQLALLDPGTSDFAGLAIWMEAHYQDPAVFRRAEDSGELSRYVMLSPAFLLLMAVFFALYMITRFRRCPSNRILVVYGRTSKGMSSKTLHGGGTFVWPVIQHYGYLHLDPMQIEIPLPDPLPAVIPETMALWGFDEEAGVWEEEGLMELDLAAGIYRGTITHLSPWNADQPMSATCLRGRVEDPDGNPVSGAIVYAEGVDYLGGSTATSDEDGDFCVAVRKDSQVEITVYDWGNGSAVRQVDSGSADTEVPPLCSDPRCQDEGVWTIVPGEGPAPWDPASCTPPEDEPVRLAAALDGDFAVELDVTRADGLEVCGWVIDDPAAAEGEPGGMTMLAFFDPSGFQVVLWAEGGAGEPVDDATGWVIVQHQSEPELSGASMCSFDIARHEQVADDVWGVTGMGECTGWIPGAPEGSLTGSLDFSGIGGELGGLFPTLCCDLSGVPMPAM